MPLSKWVAGSLLVQNLISANLRKNRSRNSRKNSDGAVAVRCCRAIAARAAPDRRHFVNNAAPETRTHHADNSSVLVSYPRDHNCSAVVIPNMLGQLHSGASIRVVPCDPFLQGLRELLRLLLRIEWTVLRVHVWHDMLGHPDLVPR